MIKNSVLAGARISAVLAKAELLKRAARMVKIAGNFLVMAVAYYRKDKGDN